MTSPGPAASRQRPTIDERAARRERIESAGADRYTSLLRALHAGQEVPLRRRQSRSLEWHPIAAKLLVAAILAVIAYYAVVTGYNAWRDSRVDTWSGPDTTVSSGQRLADCPVVNALHHDTFPTWIRYGGRVYAMTGRIRPTGTEPNPNYPATPYQVGDLRLQTIQNTPDGREGRIILLRLADSPVGEVFELVPDCT